MTNAVSDVVPFACSQTIVSVICQLLPWIFLLVIMVCALVVPIRWIMKKSKDRDPTGYALLVSIQILYFLCFNTMVGIIAITAGVPEGMLSRGGFALWYLSLNILLAPLLWNIVLSLFSIFIVCIAARRLPKLPFAIVFPVILVLLDVALILTWTTHLVVGKSVSRAF